MIGDIKQMEKLKQWMYYVIIGIISIIALCFLPMIGSSAGLDWNTPNTTVGWIVWVTLKLIVAVLNVLIFHCFMLQAKINIKDNAKYKEALQILQQNELKEFKPQSPSEWIKRQYGHKGVTIFITTALSTIALTQALLVFDWMAMLTYLFTIVMGLIFGILQMKTAEDYWTDEFWQYAQQISTNCEMVKRERIQQKHDFAGNNSGNCVLGACLDSGAISNKESVVADDFRSGDSILGGPANASNSTANSIHDAC